MHLTSPLPSSTPPPPPPPPPFTWHRQCHLLLPIGGLALEENSSLTSLTKLHLSCTNPTICTLYTSSTYLINVSWWMGSNPNQPMLNLGFHRVRYYDPCFSYLVCSTPLMASLIVSVGGLSKYFYQGLWLADLKANVIGQFINRRGVA